MAGIHPLKAGGGLSDGEIRLLHEAIRRIGQPTDSESSPKQQLVPRSEGEPCTRCGRPIMRRTVRGRSTYFCSNDQGVVAASYRIVDYDPQWPRLFREEKVAIVATLGIGARRVEHIGSTSVPGARRQADRRPNGQRAEGAADSRSQAAVPFAAKAGLRVSR